jgi:hypothetical protein
MPSITDQHPAAASSEPCASAPSPGAGGSGAGSPLATAELRKLSEAQLEQLGQQSLREHLVAQAGVARAKHGPLTSDRLGPLLSDPDCLRHPVRLVFEFGEMAMHQFGQPDTDWRNVEQDGRVLYLRPALRERPGLLPLAVAYLIPVINYGDIISDDHCLAYGSALLGLTEEDYYHQMCALADLAGAEARSGGPSGN